MVAVQLRYGMYVRPTSSSLANVGSCCDRIIPSHAVFTASGGDPPTCFSSHEGANGMHPRAAMTRRVSQMQHGSYLRKSFRAGALEASFQILGSRTEPNKK